MIVKSVMVNNLKLFIEELLKELCKNNIQYVYIPESHELHYDKYIYKFYPIEIDNKITLRGLINRKYISFLLEDDIKWVPETHNVELLDSCEDERSEYEENRDIINNSHNIKYKNHQTNMILKRNRKQNCNGHRKFK